MPRRKEPDARLIKIWEQIGESIKSGDIDALFVVFRHTEGLPRFGCATRTDDIEELLPEIRAQAMRVRNRSMH